MSEGNWPGAGTMKLPASEAHAFTIHEFAGPSAERIDKVPARDQQAWLKKYREELGVLLAAPDRPLVPGDLVYAATARCRCGAGYCYPNFVHDGHGRWFCSAILIGTAPADSEHDNPKPFAFWKIKGEGQPSAAGATTLPAPTT